MLVKMRSIVVLLLVVGPLSACFGCNLWVMSFSRACFSKDSEVQSILKSPSKTAFVDLIYLVRICCRRSRSALLETFGYFYLKTMTISGLCCTLNTVAATSLVPIQGPNVKLDGEYMASPLPCIQPSKTLLLHIVSVW